LELPEHFSCSASHLANALRMKISALQQAMDVVGLSFGEFHVPRRVRLQVLTVDVRVSRGIGNCGKTPAGAWPFEDSTLMACQTHRQCCLMIRSFNMFCRKATGAVLIP
jgi:hypothetical protein